MKRYRVSIVRSALYEVEAESVDEAFDLAFGENQDLYEIDSDTIDHTIEELEEVAA